MQNEHVLSGLVRKWAEIAAKIELVQTELRKLAIDLSAIDTAIRLFDPTASIGTAVHRPILPLRPAARGEMMRHVLSALRDATGPLTSHEIADIVMAGRGLDKDDQDTAQIIRTRVIAAMWKLKRRGIAGEVPIDGELKGWVRARI